MPRARRNTAPEPTPRFSILSYLRDARRPPKSSPPSYHTIKTKSKPHRTPECRPLLEDEENDVGFWGEPCSPPDDEDATWSVWDVLAALTYALVILMMVVNFDVLLSRYGVGTMVGKGIGEWYAEGVNAVPASVSGKHMVHFCLQSQDRAAPGPRTWRYIPVTWIDDCNAEVVSLEADPVEEWKLVYADEILVGFGEDANDSLGDIMAGERL